MTRKLLLLVLLLSGCAMHHPPVIPERYTLPLVPPDDVLCVQQGPDAWSCIKVGDLRKLLGSMGHA